MNLLRALQPRIAPIELRDVAELALIGTAARELDAAEEIALERSELVGRQRKIGQRAALARGEHDLARRP